MPTFPRPYIYTYSGNRFEYGNPRTKVLMTDVVNHLAHQTRFTGATREPYWIAQHAVVVADILKTWGCDALSQLYGLHHDDHEFCMGDFPTPFQWWLTELNGGRDILKEAKAALDNVIMPAMGLPWPPQMGIWELVKAADASAFICEAEQLFLVKPDWTEDYIARKGVRRVDMPIQFMSSSAAFDLYVETQAELTLELGA